MNKCLRRVLCMVLVLAALLPILATSAFAAPQINYNSVVYHPAKAGYDNWVALPVLEVGGLSSSQKVTSVKSSNSDIFKVRAVQYGSNTASVDKSYDSSYDRGTTYSNRWAYIIVSSYPHKTGSTTISFKIGTKSYSKKITLKEYVNPVKSMTVTGINSGNNIASKFKNNTSYSMKIGKDISNGKVVVTPISGWTISSIGHNRSNGSSYINYPGGTSKAVLYTGKISGSELSTIEVGFRNKSNGGTIFIDLYLNY